MTLSHNEITEITTYLDASTTLPEKADLIFIPGTRFPTPAEIAADLFGQGIAPYIVVTGGSNRITGEYEAMQHRDLLLASGVPEDRIITEGQSTNTLENVTFSLPLIAEKVSLASLSAVLAICKWMHSRRVLMTLKCHFPPGVRYYAHTYAPAGITRENWHLHAQTEGARVLKNWERIPQYLARGHLSEVAREGDGYI